MSIAPETPVRSSMYRALFLLPDGEVIATRRLSAADDREAITLVKAMVDYHAVELWNGLRYVEYFVPEPPSPVERT